jgi:hypothetical protein
MSKNQTGNLVLRTRAKEDRLLEKIDERSGNGKNMENVDHVWKKHTVNQEGDRVWSF